jgi:hypothetical protein
MAIQYAPPVRCAAQTGGSQQMTLTASRLSWRVSRLRVGSRSERTGIDQYGISKLQTTSSWPNLSLQRCHRAWRFLYNRRLLGRAGPLGFGVRRPEATSRTMDKRRRMILWSSLAALLALAFDLIPILLTFERVEATVTRGDSYSAIAWDEPIDFRYTIRGVLYDRRNVSVPDSMRSSWRQLASTWPTGTPVTADPMLLCSQTRNWPKLDRRLQQKRGGPLSYGGEKTRRRKPSAALPQPRQPIFTFCAPRKEFDRQ